MDEAVEKSDNPDGDITHEDLTRLRNTDAETSVLPVLSRTRMKNRCKGVYSYRIFIFGLNASSNPRYMKACSTPA